MNEFVVMTLMHSDGTIVQQHLMMIMDTVNIPLNMEVQGMIPTDWWDLQSIGWITPVPARSDYFVDEYTQKKYSVFGEVAPYPDHIEVRVSRPVGAIP